MYIDRDFLLLNRFNPPKQLIKLCSINYEIMQNDLFC